MATILLPPDFKEFLRLLNANGVEYLVVGGYAVNYHGYPRAAGDIDVWVAINPENAAKLVSVLHDFGFPGAEVASLLQPDTVLRMGVPPLRIGILTSIDGVEFAPCFEQRVVTEIDGVPVKLIDAASLKANKRASGTLNDLADLEALP